MQEYLTLFIGSVVVNNFVLTKFLGLMYILWSF